MAPEASIPSDDAASFEVFRERHRLTTDDASVTILKSGMLSISAAAHELLGSLEAVELMFDSTRQVIGLRGVATSEPHAYPVRAVGARTGAGPHVISGTAFLKFFGIRADTSRRWTAIMADDVLTVDLRVAGVPVTSNRAATARPRTRRADNVSP